MKLWLLEEGEKTGPFESFTVRERVANGELKAETPAWYDGADGWVTLADVPSMTSAFPRKEAELIEFNADDLDIQKMGEHRHGVQIPDQLIRPPALHPLRRFSARMIDVFLYMMLVVAVKLMQGMDIYDPLTASQQFMYSVPYVVIDALMMHLFGTTIGKYFLNIHVSSATGERLTFGASLLRSGRVWVIGLGMFTILMPISFLFSWMLSRKFGKFLWDVPRNLQVVMKPLQPVKLFGVFVVVMFVSSLVTYNIPEEMLPKGTFSEQLQELISRQKGEE